MDLQDSQLLCYHAVWPHSYWESCRIKSRFSAPFCLCFRPLACSELEDVLQRRDARKASGVWISVPAVLEKLPELIAKDFVDYFKNGTGRDGKDSVLLVYNEDREIRSEYTTDRSKKTTVKPVSCRQYCSRRFNMQLT